MTLTSFIDALKAQLEADMGIVFVRGYVGSSEERDLGSVYPLGTNPWETDILVEHLRVGVRVFKRHQQEFNPDIPVDTTELEALMDSLKASVQAHQKGQGPWFEQLQEVRFDAPAQMFEAEVLAWDTNPAV